MDYFIHDKLRSMENFTNVYELDKRIIRLVSAGQKVSNNNSW